MSVQHHKHATLPVAGRAYEEMMREIMYQVLPKLTGPVVLYVGKDAWYLEEIPRSPHTSQLDPAGDFLLLFHGDVADTKNLPDGTLLSYDEEYGELSLKGPHEGTETVSIYNVPFFGGPESALADTKLGLRIYGDKNSQGLHLQDLIDIAITILENK